jgi:hypothetical protein
MNVSSRRSHNIASVEPPRSQERPRTGATCAAEALRNSDFGKLQSDAKLQSEIATKLPPCNLRRFAAPNELRLLLSAMNPSKAAHLRDSAAILLIWDTWARPHEILNRWYPRDFRHDDNGLTIILPRSKTNFGPNPEYLLTKHNQCGDSLCPLCALEAWLARLGPDYTGPLFPWVYHDRPVRKQPIKGAQLRLVLVELSNACGIEPPLTPYSLRRGGATTAATLRWSFDQIRRKLRHTNCKQSADYINSTTLLEMMRRLMDRCA